MATANRPLVRRHLEEAEDAASGVPKAAPPASAPKGGISFFKSKTLTKEQKAAKQAGLVEKLRQRKTEPQDTMLEEEE